MSTGDTQVGDLPVRKSLHFIMTITFTGVSIALLDLTILDCSLVEHLELASPAKLTFGSLRCLLF
jgi:hypothetical protein